MFSCPLTSHTQSLEIWKVLPLKHICHLSPFLPVWCRPGPSPCQLWFASCRSFLPGFPALAHTPLPSGFLPSITLSTYITAQLNLLHWLPNLRQSTVTCYSTGCGPGPLTSPSGTSLIAHSRHTDCHTLFKITEHCGNRALCLLP